MNAVLPMKGDSRWPPALAALGVVLAALLWLYRDTVLAMVDIWSRSETFTHAFTVPPIALWLIWRQRALLAQMTPRPVPWLVLPMALVALAWLLGQLATVNALMQFALVALLVLSVPAVLGWEVARAIQFPLLFLFFAVPFGEFLMPQLMDWTADFTVWALQLSGIPVLRDGLQFTIPTGHWSVEAACSGIRYLMASLMVGTLFAYLNYSSMLRRWVFVAISGLVPIVANWLRAYLIVMLGHLSGNELATGADHLVYGWVFFGVVILAMLAIGGYWSQPEGAPAAVAPPPAGVSPRSASRAAMLVGAAALAVLALPHGLLARVQGGAPASLHGLEALAAPAAGWSSSPQPPADWRHAFLNPTQQLQRSYVRGAEVVGLQLAYYGSETPDGKLVSSTNGLVAPENGQWVQARTGRQTVPTRGEPLDWRTAELRSLATGLTDAGGTRLTVWRIYWINGELIAGDARAKAQLALNRLLGRGSDGAVIMVYTLKRSPEQDTATLQAFVRDHLDALTDGLRRARDGAP